MVKYRINGSRALEFNSEGETGLLEGVSGNLSKCAGFQLDLGGEVQVCG